MRSLPLVTFFISIPFAVYLLAGSSQASDHRVGHLALDWPQFHFDDDHTGNNTQERRITLANLPSLKERWSAQLDGPAYNGSPTVVDDVVYVTADHFIDVNVIGPARLTAYSAGGCGEKFCTTPLWSSTDLFQIQDTPTVANGMVYVGSQTSRHSNNGKLNAFSAAGCGQAICAPVWQGDLGNLPPLSSSATVSAGKVFITTPIGKLFVFDANGCGKSLCKPIWTGKMEYSVLYADGA